MKVYKALQLSLLAYAAPAWQPWAAPSRIEQLERCQNKALKMITGQLKSTPVETRRLEAGICSIVTASKLATALAYEKAHRLPPDHPRGQILAAPSGHRLQRQSWRSAAQVSTIHLPVELAHRVPIDSAFTCPWEDSSNWSVHAENLAPPGSKDNTTPYLSFIRDLNAQFILYTVGSATAGTLNGGAGMVVTEGDPANPTTFLMKQQRGAAITSSYDEEKAAMRMALEWLSPSHAAAAICTDSQSILKAMQNNRGLHQEIFLAGRLSGCLHATRHRSPRPSMSWSHPLLKANANQLETTVDPKSPSCGREPQTVEHWLHRCPNAVALRQQLFGEPSPPLSFLTTNPGSVLALARKTLL